ncbi:hypothetical protein Tco_0390440 [Tanacetum coccineum]
MAPLPGRGPFNGGNFQHCTNVSFGDEPVYDSNPNSYNQTLDISNPPSQPQTSSFNQFHCFHCKDPLEDGVRCQRCTCVRCGYYLGEGFCSFCNSEAGNSFVNDSNPNSFNDPPNVFTHPPQPQYESYLCELCGNDSHYGYDCPPRFPLVYEQEPSYNQNFSDNYYPQNSLSFPQQYFCCENCVGPHESFQCQPLNQNHFEHNSNYSSFDQSPQYSIDHQEDLNPQRISDVHVRWDKIEESLLNMMQSFYEVFPVIHQPPQETNTEILQARENLMEAIQAFLKKYDHIPPREKCMALLLAEERFLKIKQVVEEEQNQLEYVQELLLKLLNDLQTLNKMQLKQEEQAAKICIPYWKCPIFDDDDDEEYTIQVREYYKNSPVAITPVLPTLEPEDSLIMGNEELSTIPEKESDEFIKSSVEDLVPIPSESEDTSGSDSECILPSCDDFSPINVYEETSVTFSNPLFNSNDDFTSSDDESLSDEDVPEDNVKIYSNLLFEFDDEYISCNVNPLFDEVLENIESKDSYVPNLDEPALLVTSLSDANEDECFDPVGDIDEIDVFLDIVVSSDIVNDYYDSEGDIIYLESLLIKDTTPNLPHEVFLDHEPRSLKDKLDKEDLKSMVKVFDPGIHKKKFSPTYVSLSFEDRHYLSFTYVIRISLPYFTYPVDSSFPLSSGSEDIIFDPDISAFHFSSLEPVAYEYPMEVCSSTCFVPNITMIWGESS